MASQGPTVRGRRIGALLRQYREAAGYSMDDVAQELGCHSSRVSRIETARALARPPEAKTMLAMFGVTGQPADEIMTLVRESRQRGWWEQFRDASADLGSFIGLETEAGTLRTYEPIMVPGLLQTEDYARAALHATTPDMPADELEERVRVRMTRQDVLTRVSNPLTLFAVIDEAALRRVVGGPDVMSAQLARVKEEARRTNVRIQVLPFSAGAPASPTGPLVLIQFPDPQDEDVGYIESWTGDLYVERPEMVSRSTRMIDDLCAAALSPQESVQFMSSIRYE